MKFETKEAMSAYGKERGSPSTKLTRGHTWETSYEVMRLKDQGLDLSCYLRITERSSIIILAPKGRSRGVTVVAAYYSLRHVRRRY